MRTLQLSIVWMMVWIPVSIALPAGAQECVAVVDPVPIGIPDRPGETSPGNLDFRFAHSATHLQGQLASVKWAGGLVHLPPASTGLQGFTSAVVVNNPSPTFPLTVRIDYFDHAGTLVGSSLPTIAPEGFHAEAATPLATSSGVGTARVTSLGGWLVGASLLHSTKVFDRVDPDTPLSINGQPPGASSIQQLQKVQAASTELWWGPLTLTTSSPIDFLNGQAPFLWVVNPNAVPNTVRVEVVAHNRRNGTVASAVWRTVTLPPNSTLLEVSGPHLTALGPGRRGIWNAFLASYAAAPGRDRDVVVKVVSEDGLPILGNGVMTDFHGDNGTDNLAPGTRFRMASTMLASTPSNVLLNPDLTYRFMGGLQTVMGVSNVGATDAGPLTLEYYDSFGALLSTFTVASLPPNRSLRIHPGVLGYPAAPGNFGWARIRACRPEDRLVGWTVREVTLDATQPPGTPQYFKAYGESLLATNGAEPGPGFATAAGPIRKVSPLVRSNPANPAFPWPGYTSLGNFSVPNIGLYSYLFFLPGGAPCGTATFAGGLPFGATSWTFEDPITAFACAAGGPVNQSGRVDHALGSIEGIDVLGDPLDEYAIPGFAIDGDTIAGELTFPGSGVVTP